MKNETSERVFETINLNISHWVQNGINQDCVKRTEEIGHFLAKNKLTTSQIRNIFGEMRRIQMNGYIKEKSSFLILKPKLAYAVKRNENKGTKSFYEVFCSGYNAIDKKNDQLGEKQFANFMQLLEAILAYPKYFGGKE